MNSVYGELSKQGSGVAVASVTQDSSIDPLRDMKRRAANSPSNSSPSHTSLSNSDTMRLRAAHEATDVGQRGDASDQPENLTMPLIAVASSALVLVASIAFAVVRFQSPSEQVAKADIVATNTKVNDQTNATPEARAVGWVLSQQGEVVVRPEGSTKTTKIEPGGQLPDGPVTVVGVSINEQGKIADGRLTPLSALKQLETADFGDTGVNDAGIGDLVSASGITNLSLTSTAVTDAGVAKLSAFPKLQRLELIGLAKVTDASASSIVSLKSLTHVNVSESGMTPEGVATLMIGLPNCMVIHGLSSESVSSVVAARKGTTTPTSAAAPTAPVKPPATTVIAAPSPGNSVDVLKSVDLARDLIDGSCKREGEQLTIQPEQGAKVRIPVGVGEDYFLTVVAERTSGDGGLGVVLRVGRVETMAVLGASNNQVNGLEPIDYMEYERNSAGRNVPAFVDAGPSTFLFHVSRGHIRVSRDDVLLVDWAGDSKHLISAKKDPPEFLPGLGLKVAAGSGFRISKMELLTPSKSNHPEQPKPTPPRLTPTFVPGRAIDLLSAIDLSKDTVAGQWQSDATGLVSPEEPGARLQIPIDPPTDYAIVVEAERLGKTGFVIGLIVNGVQTGVTPDFNRRAGMQTLDGKNADAATRAKSVDVFRDKLRHTIVAVVRGGHVQLFADGNLLSEYTSPVRRLGVAPELRVPERTQLYLGTYDSCRFTRYDLVPLNEETVAGAATLFSKHLPPDRRAPLPDENAQKEARPTAREQFRADIAKAKQPAEKLALARKMYAASLKATNLATKFALLSEARDMAVDLGDIPLVERTIDATAEAFQVNGLDMQVELWPKLTSKLRGPQPSRDFADSAISLADRLATADRYDDAKHMMELAVAAARRRRTRTSLSSSPSDRSVSPAIARVSKRSPRRPSRCKAIRTMPRRTTSSVEI